MAIEKKTPGVYVRELSAFPNSVVEVATAVPVFIGLTQQARRGQTDLLNKPTRITSFTEYQSLFGYAPATKVRFAKTFAAIDFSVVETSAKDQPHTRLYLYFAVQMFFANGGGTCYIMSVGSYDDTSGLQALLLEALPFLELEQEPTLVVVPDAVSLTFDGWKQVSDTCLLHCQTMQNRFAVLDVYHGDSTEAADSVVSNFRSIGTDGLAYGAAYYPWIHTSILSDGEIDATYLDDDSLAGLITGLKAHANDAALTPAAKQKPLLDLIDALGKGPAPKVVPPPPPGPPVLDANGNPLPSPPVVPPLTPDESKGAYVRAHNALLASVPFYKDVMTGIRDAMNLLPPSGGMAGVYARIDASRGVFKAPAGTGIIGAVRPAVNITSETQEDLNVPLDGKAINAIRSFPGNGILVWGARTLDGNSQDYRYINVRRTLIMLEQSIAIAAQAYVFEPNTSSTWTSVAGMITNFLTNQWKGGALAGTTPMEAFDVAVGLTTTMTGTDILDGYMNITVRVAIVRPAEFIVITFQQKMQTS